MAKILGDEVATIERHYAPYVRELRERARGFMDSTEGGLEKITSTILTQSPAKTRVTQ